MRKYDTIIFDLDGTLLNSLEDLQDSLNHVMAKNGYKIRSLEEVRSFVGDGVRSLIKRACPDTCTEEDIDLYFKISLPITIKICRIKPDHTTGLWNCL